MVMQQNVSVAVNKKIQKKLVLIEKIVTDAINAETVIKTQTD
jgi:hypothetical protein